MSVRALCIREGLSPSSSRRLPSLVLSLLMLGVIPLTLALFPPGALACVTCDSAKNCHSGDEQGGYLCESGEVSCNLLLKLLGAGCEGRYCRTMSVCDNRKLTPVLESTFNEPSCGDSDANPLDQDGTLSPILE